MADERGQIRTGRGVDDAHLAAVERDRDLFSIGTPRDPVGGAGLRIGGAYSTPAHVEQVPVVPALRAHVGDGAVG
jgi:hypothetical protein